MNKLKKRLNEGSGADLLATLLAVFVGLLLGLVILLISNPAQAFRGFGAIISGGFGNMKDVGQVLYYATPILMTGLSVGFANKVGLFNIGASGQFIVGAYAAILVGVKCTFLPGFLHCFVALSAAVAAGGLWGCIPGMLKAYRNVNEVIAGIMCNYIGMFLVNYLIPLTAFDSLKNQSMRPAAAANLPKLGMDLIFREGNTVSSANSGFLVAVIAAVGLYIFLEKTAFGYELKACGLNKHAAKYVGINENRNIVLSMAIAGALAGLGGALLYLAGSGKGIDVVDTIAAEGFNGIPVALLGLNNPVGIIFSALLISHLNVGGFNMQLYGFAPQVIEIVIAVIIYFSAFSLLLKTFLQKSAKNRSKPHQPAEVKAVKQKVGRKEL